MSEAAKAARAAMKAKAHRLVGSSKGAVDASGWTEPTDMNADVKTGARPVSPRLYKRGGKVEGVMAKHHAGRKPRKSGGRAITADSLINRDVREANDERAGKKHDGAFKRGGKVKRQHHADGNPVIQQGREAPPVTTWQRMKDYNPSPDYTPQTDPNYVPPITSDADRRAMDALAAKAAKGRKHGGKVHKLAGGPAMNPQQMAAMMQAGQRPGLAQTLMRRKHGGKAEHPDVAEDKALIRKMVKPEARTGKKDGGGNWIAGAIKHPGALHKSLHVPAGEKIPAKKLAKAAHSDNPKLAKRARLAETLKHMHHAKGGSAVADGEYEGTRPTGGRMARKDGGRAGKGKMNVNIIIAGKHPDSAMGNPMMPPGGGMPPRLPAQPVPVPPPQGMPPAGAGAPMAMPVPMPMQAGPQGMPPMGRKSGGRAYPIHDGAGGGEGRLEKIRAYGLTPPRG